MELPALRAILAPIERDGKLAGYHYVSSVASTTFMKECALTRAITQAIAQGSYDAEMILVVSFVDENGNKVTTIDKNQNGVRGFFAANPQFHPLTINQHMAEVGKMLISRYDEKTTLTALFGPEFAARIDTHQWLKLAQIACQPGRLVGECELTTHEQPTVPVESFVFNAYIDSKRPSEDGMIYVDPTYWQELLTAYSTPDHPLNKGTTLIKVNSCTGSVAIKGVFQKADPVTWAAIVARCGREDFQVLLCGNAIKDNTCLEVGQVYELDQQYFAYHADSGMHRGFRVNLSKQILTRSGMDTAAFLDMAIEPAISRIAGLMAFNEDDVVAAIGAFTKDGEETTLEKAAAIKKRIMQQGLPANHPVNVLQIWRLAMTVIRERCTRVDIDGFHGMGAASAHGRGWVGVPLGVYKQWLREHGTNQVYLYRMPFLGPYGGMYATIYGTDTDTIHVNWEDALQMEGDFDGDQYFIVPAKYIKMASSGTKPPRPAKGVKSYLPLNEANLLDAMINLATNKNGIGPRDYLLCIAYDMRALAYSVNDQALADRWDENIVKLQIYVQQAVEGLKHGSEDQLTQGELKEMFQDDVAAHPYTKLVSNRIFRESNLQSTRLIPGYIDLIKQTVKDEYAWHPLHGIFSRLAKLDFGSVADVWPYWEAAKAQRVRGLSKTQISPVFSQIRDLYRAYTAGIKRWNGGNNKNVSFGKDILLPIRQQWEALLATHCQAENPLAAVIFRDLHVMLAKVAYDPQPNWRLTHAEHGLFRLMANKATFGKVVPNRMKQRIKRAVIYYNDNKTLIDVLDRHRVSHRTVITRRWLPRSGSLFHHLADPQQVKQILDAALPKVSRDEMMNTLLQAIRLA